MYCMLAFYEGLLANFHSVTQIDPSCNKSLIALCSSRQWQPLISVCFRIDLIPVVKLNLKFTIAVG